MNRSSFPTLQATEGAAPAPIPSSSVISARALVKVFGSGDQAVTAVNGVDIDIMPGEFLAITGRSVYGKTTLLNLLAGLDQPNDGGVIFEGRNLGEFSEAQLVDLRRTRIAFVFQSFGLIPLLSAFENVELPLHIGGAGWRERRQKAAEALELVGLGSRTGHRPYELSGGEQQRVAIARALVAGPSVLFADEPTGELDSVTGITIATILRDIARERGVTVITATHDLALAGMCTRRLEMADGEFVKGSGGQAGSSNTER